MITSPEELKRHAEIKQKEADEDRRQAQLRADQIVAAELLKREAEERKKNAQKEVQEAENDIRHAEAQKKVAQGRPGILL